MCVGSGHWPAQQHSIKATDSMLTDSAKYRKTTEKDNFDLHRQILTLMMLQCSKRSHVCAQTNILTLTGLSEQLWHLWSCAVLEPVQSLLSVQHWGHMFHIEWKPNSVWSLLSQRQSVWGSGLYQFLCLPPSSGKPTGGQQLAHKKTHLAWTEHTVFSYTRDSEDMGNTILQMSFPKGSPIRKEPHVFA